MAQWTTKLATCDLAALPGRWWLGLPCNDIKARVQTCPDQQANTKQPYLFVYDCKYCSDSDSPGQERNLPDGTRCDDNDIRTRNDRCTNGVCSGTPYTCGPCERHDGESCVILSQVNAGDECDTSAHATTCTKTTENLMGCPKVSHRRPTATAGRVVAAVDVMGQCCYMCVKGTRLPGCKSWAFSVQTNECRLYTITTASALEDGRDAYNWHTGQVSTSPPNCAPYTSMTDCETSGLACSWVKSGAGGSCLPAADFRQLWKFIPATLDMSLNYYDREHARPLLAIGTKSSMSDCQSWCKTWSESGLRCLAWNWWENDRKCELLRTVREWVQPMPSEPVWSGYRTPFASLPYAGAGVCKVGGSCKQSGKTDDSPAQSPAHAPGDRMGCGMCNPLSSQSALSELSYPKWCYVRTDVCDLDVACNIAQKTCGDNSNGQYYRPDTVPCRPPAWDTSLYPESDLSPYDTPWDFPNQGSWANWNKQWLFDADRSLYYHLARHGICV